MTKSICGIDCTKCELNKSCNGCAETKGKPFGAECMVALCLKDGQKSFMRIQKQNLIAALNKLNIQGMEKSYKPERT